MRERAKSLMFFHASPDSIWAAVKSDSEGMRVDAADVLEAALEVELVLALTLWVALVDAEEVTEPETLLCVPSLTTRPEAETTEVPLDPDAYG